MPDQQFGLLGPIPSSASQPVLDRSLWTGGGIDFGASAPPSGQSYGVLGDVRALAQKQPCANCQQGQPCQDDGGQTAGDGGDGDDDAGDGGGHVIDAQYVVPGGGLFPPLLPPQTQQPGPPPIVGDPNAWWNKGDADVGEWIKNWAEARATKAVERQCDAQLAMALGRCKAIARRATAEAGPEAGSRELEACNKQSMTRYGECLANKGQAKSPEYPDWYGED